MDNLRPPVAADTSDEARAASVDNARLLREQAATIAHYKKMYDRSSAMAKIGIWEYDLVNDRMMWTDGVYDLFELPHQAPVKRADVVAYYDPESRREMERLRAEAIRTGGSFTIEVLIRTAKGNARWICLTADVEQEDGRSVRIFGTKQDISQARFAQDKVQALQTELIHVSRRSAMGAMAETLAHELNQPLAAISNYVAGTRRALNSGDQGNEIVEDGLEAIEKCAFRAGDIIRSLRAMTSKSAVRRQGVNLNPLIREAGSIAMLGSAEAAPLRYALGDDVAVSVDPVQIQQVIVNLVKNALDAARDPAGCEIVIATSVNGGTVAIQVEDNGHGIASDILETLFDSFVTSKSDGMGVGLSISRTIVEAHGGKIAAANRASGGAIFTVTLPIAYIG